MKLDALTSLRFFAALMIVLLHSAEIFFPTEKFTSYVRLNQGVTFFFVLSGFILTYVHPHLSDFDEVKQFLLSRLARIWPSHLVTAFLTLWLLPGYSPSSLIIFTNLFLLHAWVPKAEYYFSLNSVSWSISVELFFYICFIFLIRTWRYGWLSKIAISLSPVLLFLILVHLFAIPENDPNNLSQYFLFYINPLSRLGEFVFGMATGHIFTNFKKVNDLNSWQITLLEIFVCILVLANIFLFNNLAPIFSLLPKECSPLLFWSVNSSTAPLFSLLIFVFAVQKGFISRLLTHPIFVWLGEISYSIYLFHYLLKQYFISYLAEFYAINAWLAFFTYLLFVILLSHLNFHLVENPCRKLLKEISLSKNFLSPISAAFNYIRSRFYSISIAVVIIIIVLLLDAFYIEKRQDRFHYKSIIANQNIHFENKLALDKIQLGTSKDGAKLHLTWRSLCRQHLNSLIILQLHSADHRLLAQYNHYQSLFNRLVHAGQILPDEIYIPSCEYKSLSHLTLSILTYNPNRLLVVQGAHSENYSTQLILPISEKSLSI